MKHQTRQIGVDGTGAPRRSGRRGGGGGRARGFTLIELLIAVGAVAILAVALAAVFAATGRTLTVGRRVSAFNAYAGLIELQLRHDFALMTRDGFLVIRNELANTPANGGAPNIRLYDGDTRPRPRRIDEIVFFVKGDFTTAREPLDAAFVARAGAARIYFGHGKRMIVDTSTGSVYLMPEPGDQNDDPDANLGVNDVDNPNRFASDWILLRHVTLLCPPSGTTQVIPTPAPFNLSAAQMRDDDVQARLQPAASSIFRSLSTIFPVAPGSYYRAMGRPQFPSGLVDIATTDLAEIRAVVTTADVPPNGAGVNFFDPAFNTPPDGNNEGVDGLFRLQGAAPQDPDVLGRMQSWMDEVFPTWSMASAPQDRVRLRCEPQATNYAGILGDETLSPLERAYRRGDQVMLGASNFLPRCTEFIVEWTFGVSYPSDPGDVNYVVGRAGDLIWHGMRRTVGGVDVADVYDSTPGAVDVFQIPFRRLNNNVNSYRVRDDLVHGQGFVAANVQPGEPITSFFGYIDPTFDPGANDPPTIPWAWPKLIRVTLTLADPNDPSIEQTFQYVFETPGNPEP